MRAFGHLHGGCGMRGKFFRGAAVAVTLVVSATTASAQTSQLNIFGSARVFQQLPGAANNLIVDFLPPTLGGNGSVFTTINPADQTGVFSFLAPLTMGLNTDFVFGTGPTPPPTTLPTTILTIGGFTFTGTTFGSGNVPGTPVILTYDPTANTTSATVNVLGTVTGPGLVGGKFTGSYTTQFPGIDPVTLQAQIESGTVLSKSISATFIVSSVPEPATVALMGTGLIALFGAVRRRRTEV